MKEYPNKWRRAQNIVFFSFTKKVKAETDFVEFLPVLRIYLNPNKFVELSSLFSFKIEPFSREIKLNQMLNQIRVIYIQRVRFKSLELIGHGSNKRKKVLIKSFIFADRSIYVHSNGKISRAIYSM